MGRLSYGTVFLSLTLALTSATASYSTAGAIMALFAVTVSALTPLRAALVDRHGLRRVLPALTCAYAVALAALAATTWRPGVPAWALALLTAAAGAAAPPLGPVMRTLWHGLLPGGPLVARAYSLDTVAEELLYVAGPLLAGLAALRSPSLGIALSAVLIVAGTVGMITSPGARPRPGTPVSAPGRPGPAGRAAPPAAAATAAATIGVTTGALGLLAVAFTRAHHWPAAVAWIEAALAIGSALGGLAYGTRTWRASPRTRLGLLVGAVGLSLAAAGVAPSVPGLVLAAWVSTALNLGTSAGTAAIGPLLERLPLPLCFAVAAAPALPAALYLLASVRTTHPSPPR
ncbi:MFS transporter [Actinomadura fibrosa]|uniref:MFS transporter n=1 Tax=Actinomadura fibrosa TaxID=111802 RepID=UPI001A9548B0|nr:MFS transporter [Actinomadura fibrosa]